MLNIQGNVFHFRPIPNDMVMESRLPCKRNIVFVGIFGDGGFVLSNDSRQAPATMGTALHFFVFVQLGIINDWFVTAAALIATALVGQSYRPTIGTKIDI